MRHLAKLYFVIFLSIVFAISYLFIKTSEIQRVLNANVEQILVDEAKTFAHNIETQFVQHLKQDPYTELKQSPQLRHHLENALSILRSDAFKYIFVLYKDKHGSYRFLLDGSKEKAFFNQRLNVDKALWDQVYTTQTPVIINQKKLDGLWITYLKPIVFNGETKAIIAIDFSKQLPTSIYNAIKPLNNILFYIFIAIGFLVVILIYQTVLSFKIKKQSITDPLTQIYNRSYLNEELKKMNMSSYQIMMCDIDYFKKVNDNYGHKAGDEVLVKVAKTIQSELTHDDILIRFGGEEFLLFTKKSKNGCSAYEIAQRIREKIEATSFVYENNIMKITLSIGITCQPEHFKTATLAIKHADEMLYIAKREGRNKVISTTTHKKLAQEGSTKTISDVKTALEEGRILCYFQAIFDIQTQEIVKYEALVRMQEEDGSIVPPIAFLDNIMYTTVYNDLTKTVLESVFVHIKKYECTMSVNLNFSDILDNTIYELIIGELQEHKSLAPWLIVELLEYEVLAETESLVLERLLHIKSFGVHIAIDDFGSGYSNYTMFKTLPIDILKIDGSLIKDLDTSKVGHTIIHSIVLLAKELGIKTVAEFVHSEKIFEEVKRLGIDEAQGFYLAKPEPLG
jgi:diguanylate cyclase (GGDEF)-like protein